METYRCNSYVYVSNDAAYAQFSLSPHLLMYFVLLLVLFFVSYVFLLYIYIYPFAIHICHRELQKLEARRVSLALQKNLIAEIIC